MWFYCQLLVNAPGMEREMVDVGAGRRRGGGGGGEEEGEEEEEE